MAAFSSSLCLSPIPVWEDSVSACCSMEALRRPLRDNVYEVLESTRIEDEDNSEVEARMPYDQIPVLEVGEKEDVYTGEDNPKMLQAYKGQLRLSVYINSGLLTIHIKQAKDLISKSRNLCSAYVKIGLVPDCKFRARCHTDIVPNSNHPHFDEKFSVELLPEDLNKRLVISIWHRNSGKRCSELIGCTSFGILNIANRKTTVNDWYYLLAREIGQTKHLQVAPRQWQKSSRRSLDVPTENVRLQASTLILRKGRSSGYGFSVTGNQPTRVCKIVPGSPAEEAKLQLGDYIVKVNRANVSTASVECVGRIIRHSQVQVTLDILRPVQPVPAVPSLVDLLPCTMDSSSGSSSSNIESDSSLALSACVYDDKVITGKSKARSQARGESKPKRKKVTFKDLTR